MAAPPAKKPASGVIVELHGRTAGTPTRSADVIRAELQDHLDAARILIVELGTASGGDPSKFSAPAAQDVVLSLQRAAHEIGWTERRLRRHIVKHNRHNPKDPIGYQPGGMPNTAWCIPLARLQRYVRDQRP
jgi:hypothetical protein